MNQLRTAARMLSRGMRGGNAAVALLGALMTARVVARWLDRPDRELLYSRTLKPGQGVRIEIPDKV